MKKLRRFLTVLLFINFSWGMAMESISKEEIDLRKVVKRMRGARPWHPLLQALRKELEG